MLNVLHTRSFLKGTRTYQRHFAICWPFIFELKHSFPNLPWFYIHDRLSVHENHEKKWISWCSYADISLWIIQYMYNKYKQKLIRYFWKGNFTCFTTQFIMTFYKIKIRYIRSAEVNVLLYSSCTNYGELTYFTQTTRYHTSKLLQRILTREMYIPLASNWICSSFNKYKEINNRPSSVNH